MIVVDINERLRIVKLPKIARSPGEGSTVPELEGGEKASEKLSSLTPESVWVKMYHRISTRAQSLTVLALRAA